MVADVLAEHSAVVAEPVREAFRRRIQENEIGVERRRIHEDDARLILGHRVGVRVDDADAGRLALRLVVDNGVDHRVRTNRQVAGLRRPR